MFFMKAENIKENSGFLLNMEACYLALEKQRRVAISSHQVKHCLFELY